MPKQFGSHAPSKKTRNDPAAMGRAVEIACKRMSSAALRILEMALDPAQTPDLEFRWRLAAVKEVLDRGFGKPKQSIDASITVESGDALVLAIKESQNAIASGTFNVLDYKPPLILTNNNVIEGETISQYSRH